MPTCKILLICGFLPMSAVNAEVLYKYGGKSVDRQSLPPAAAQAMFDAEMRKAEAANQVIDAHIFAEHVKELAKKQGKSEEDIEKSLVPVKVSEADAKAWFEENKERLGGRDFAPIKMEIISHLEQTKGAEARDAFVSDLKKKNKFQSMVKMPVAPVLSIASEGYPSKGNKKAKVTLIEFADYTCPHCQEAVKDVKKVVDKYGQKINVIFMDFPLRYGGLSTQIAEGAVCADAQGKFWEFHHMAFDKQSSLTPAFSMEAVKTLGLDAAKFTTCLADNATKQKVRKSRDEGERIGIQGTPSLYVNGQKVNGHSFEKIIEAIEAKL